MCVICVKKSGSIVGKKLIKKMYTANPDLCGVSYQSQGKVITLRGLSDNELLHVNKTIPIESTAVYHFRIATSGNVDLINSHPFPLWGDKTKGEVITDYSLSHNGIFHNNLKGIYSDTYDIVKLIETTGIKKSISWLEYLCAKTGSKLAILSQDDYHLIGDFKTLPNHEGLLFSNLIFSYPLVSKTTIATGYYNNQHENNYDWRDDRFFTVSRELCLSCDIPLLQSEVKTGFCFNCNKSLPKTCDFCSSPINGINRLSGLCDDCEEMESIYKKEEGKK